MSLGLLVRLIVLSPFSVPFGSPPIAALAAEPIYHVRTQGAVVQVLCTNVRQYSYLKGIGTSQTSKYVFGVLHTLVIDSTHT